MKKVATLLCMVVLCAGFAVAQTGGGSAGQGGTTKSSTAKPKKTAKAKKPKAPKKTSTAPAK